MIFCRNLWSIIKKTGPIVLLLLFAAGCSPKYLTVSYLPPAPTNLSGPLVALQVNDQRGNKTIISPALQAKGIFAGSASRLDIVVTGPDGQTSRLMEVGLERAFEEAVKARLRSAGFQTFDPAAIGATNRPATFRLTIDIQQFYLDIDGRRLTADVAFTATSFKRGKEVFKEEISGQSERVHLIGTSEAEKALSQALANAVDSMSLQALGK